VSASQTGNRDVRRCYICNKFGHVAKLCKTSNKEKEASGNLSKSDHKVKPPSSPHTCSKGTNKQVSTQPISVKAR